VTATNGHTYAVVKLVGSAEECSGAGGTHYTLEVDESAKRILHGGGHASYGELARRDSEPKGYYEYYVAEVTVEGHAGLSSSNPGWCIEHLPPYFGRASHFVAATDLADARAKLAALTAR
jgi:acetylornithine deacetylase/succinyl-diaminopimelate desuccinylase-like protein